MADPASAKVRCTHPEKVLYPSGFTKGEVVDYYRAVAPVMLPHLAGRALTLRRFPDGVEGTSFYEKRCPSHRPAWMPTVSVASGRGTYRACSAAEVDDLAWLANMAALEIHPQLARADQPDVPTVLVFDLDPGAPADVLTCAAVAVELRQVLGDLGLQCWVKTSGSKGLQVYAPLNSPTSYAVTKPLARSIAVLLEREHPDLVVSSMAKTRRAGRVLIDWSQNDRVKTTVAVYSLRARPEPQVSTPVTWEEVDAALRSQRAEQLTFTAPAVLARVADHGDRFAPVLTRRQELPVDLVQALGAADA